MGADPEAELTVEQLLDEARTKLDRLTSAQANAAHHDGAILVDIRSELQCSTERRAAGRQGASPATCWSGASIQTPPIAIRTRW
jgi:hypothetical protein